MRSMVMKITHIKYVIHGKDEKKLNINTEDIKDTNETWIHKTSRDLPSPPHANHELRKAARQKIRNERHTWCGH